MDHTYLSEIKVGDRVKGVYFISSVRIAETKHKKPFMDILLKDKTASVYVKSWDVREWVASGVFADVMFDVDEYNGAISCVIVEAEQFQGDVDTAEYFPVIENEESVYKDFSDEVEEAKSWGDDAGGLVARVFSPSVLAAFRKAPSGTGVIDGRSGGAMLDTLRLVRSVKALSGVYGLDETETRLAAASALLLRVGCVDAFSFENLDPALTHSGGLIGMEALSSFRLLSAWQAYRKDNKNADRDVFARITHVAAAYEGGRVVPCTPEAILVTSLAEFNRRITSAREAVSDAKSGRRVTEGGFTQYDFAAKRRYFVGQTQKTGKEG